MRRKFQIDPNGGQVSIDFSINLPVLVFRAFAIFKDGSVLDSQSSAPANPVGTPDYTFAPGFDQPSVVGCMFDCFGDANLIGQQIDIELFFEQDGRSKTFDLPPSLMREGPSSTSQARKIAYVDLYSR